MSAALIVTLLHLSTLAVNAGPVPQVPIGYLTSNTSPVASQSRDDEKHLGSHSGGQETQQTRPRRVNPPDSAAQPSPSLPRPANGNSKRPANGNSKRPTNGNSKRQANGNSKGPTDVKPKGPADGNRKLPAERHPSSPVSKGNSGSDRQKGIGPSYTIQVAAFLEPEKARRLAQSVSQNGYSAHVVTRDDSHGKKWYCVRVGIYPDPDQARKAATKMEGKLKLKLAIRPSNSL